MVVGVDFSTFSHQKSISHMQAEELCKGWVELFLIPAQEFGIIVSAQCSRSKTEMPLANNRVE